MMSFDSRGVRFFFLFYTHVHFKFLTYILTVEFATSHDGYIVESRNFYTLIFRLMSNPAVTSRILQIDQQNVTGNCRVVVIVLFLLL